MGDINAWVLNPAWGNVWKTNADDGYGNAIPIDLTNASAVYTTGATPEFQFQKDGTEILKNTFSISNSLASTWEMIFSLRYIF